MRTSEITGTNDGSRHHSKIVLFHLCICVFDVYSFFFQKRNVKVLYKYIIYKYLNHICYSYYTCQILY